MNTPEEFERLQEKYHTVLRQRDTFQFENDKLREDLTYIVRDIQDNVGYFPIRDIGDIRRVVSTLIRDSRSTHYSSSLTPSLAPPTINGAECVKKGYDACVEGKSKSENPYNENSAKEKYYLWRVGWTCASTEIKLEQAVVFEVDSERNIRIERRSVNPTLFVVLGYDGLILTKDGKWVNQPSMKNATQEYLDNTRWGGLNLAFIAANSAPHVT